MYVPVTHGFPMALLMQPIFNLACMKNVTVQAKTSLVHTSKFATLDLYNFGWEGFTELKFTMLVD